MEADAETARQAILKARAVLTRLGVTEVGLFGSRAKGTARPDSDWDLLLTCSQPLACRDYWQLKARLQQEFTSRVALHSPQHMGHTIHPNRFLDAIKPDLIEVYRA